MKNIYINIYLLLSFLTIIYYTIIPSLGEKLYKNKLICNDDVLIKKLYSMII